MDCKIKLIFTFCILLTSNKGFSQYESETELYECIEQSFYQKGWNLKLSLDSLENQFYEIGYLSDTVGIYDLFRYQSIEGEVPLIIDKYITALDMRINKYKIMLKSCLDNGRNIEDSKYQKLSNRLNQIEWKVPSEIWKVMEDVLDKEDFNHPYYRFTALMTLQNWSLDSPPNWYEYNVDTIEVINDTVIVIEGTAKFMGINGINLSDEEIRSVLLNFLLKYPKDHFIVIRLEEHLHNKRVNEIHSIISSSYYNARVSLTSNNPSIKHFEFLNSIPLKYRFANLRK